MAGTFRRRDATARTSLPSGATFETASAERERPMIAPVESAVPDILGRRMQFSMVVRDIDAAAHYWAESLGVGPWVMFEDAVEGRRFEHRGHVTEPIISLAMAYGGD